MMICSEIYGSKYYEIYGLLCYYLSIGILDFGQKKTKVKSIAVQFLMLNQSWC